MSLFPLILNLKIVQNLHFTLRLNIGVENLLN